MNVKDSKTIPEETICGAKAMLREVMRFPRLAEDAPQESPSGSTDDKLTAQRAILEEEARQLIASHRESRLRLGRIFNQIKTTLRHGVWRSYFHKIFASQISYRSAARYMKRAAKAEADSKKDRLTLLKSGTDEVKDDATNEARVEVGDAARPVPEDKPAYRLALHLDAVRRDATIRLWASPHRRRAEN